jgi:hypothetical protein
MLSICETLSVSVTIPSGKMTAMPVSARRPRARKDFHAPGLSLLTQTGCMTLQRVLPNNNNNRKHSMAGVTGGRFHGKYLA